MKDYDKRALLFLLIGLLFDLGFVCVYFVFSAVSGLRWYVASLLYFSLLAAGRLFTLYYSVKEYFFRRPPAAYAQKCGVFLFDGILVLLLSALVVQEVQILNTDGIAPRFYSAVIWINAIYLALQSLRNIVVVVKLAVKTVSTVSNVRRVHRQQNPLIAASKFLSYADTLASIVILIHTANLKYAAGGLWSFFLLGAGIGVRLVIFALGVYMIVQSQKLLKAERKRRESGFSEE